MKCNSKHWFKANIMNILAMSSIYFPSRSNGSWTQYYSEQLELQESSVPNARNYTLKVPNTNEWNIGNQIISAEEHK